MDCHSEGARDGNGLTMILSRMLSPREFQKLKHSPNSIWHAAPALLGRLKPRGVAAAQSFAIQNAAILIEARKGIRAIKIAAVIVLIVLN